MTVKNVSNLAADNSLENLERVIREVCAVDVEPDGMVFDPDTVKPERIKADADDEGVRIRFVGLLGKARVAMQIDVGFGDVVTPGTLGRLAPHGDQRAVGVDLGDRRLDAVER